MSDDPTGPSGAPGQQPGQRPGEQPGEQPGERPGEPEGTGSLAEEAFRLIEALGLLAGVTDDPAGSASDGSASGATAGPGGHTHGVGSAPECRVCPVCRLIVGVRRLRPEVVAHLVAAGEELLAAAREFAASGMTQEPPAGPGPTPAGDPDGGSDPTADRGPDGGPDRGPDTYRPPVRSLQRIDLD